MKYIAICDRDLGEGKPGSDLPIIYGGTITELTEKLVSEAEDSGDPELNEYFQEWHIFELKKVKSIELVESVEARDL